MSELTTHVAELLLSPKKLSGFEHNWVSDKESKQHSRLKSALEINGEIIGDFFFDAHAKLLIGNELEVALILSYRDLPIERMTYNPRGQHVNKHRHEIPKELRGQILGMGTHRIYTWENNRKFGFPPIEYCDNLPAAAEINEPISNFQQALEYFFNHTNIELAQIQEPPFNQLSLPW